MSDQENVRLVHQAFEAFDTGDEEWIRSHLADDVVYHVGGDNRFSGDYQGRDQVLGLFAAGKEATGGTLRLDPYDVIADAHHAVALGKGSAKNSKGEHTEFHFAVVFHSVDGRATEIWGLSELGPETDEFFDSLPG